MIRAAEVDDLNKAKPTLKKYAERNVKTGIVRDGEVVDIDLLVDTLTHMWNEEKFTTRDVVLGIGNPNVLARNKVLSELALKNARTSLPLLVQDDLPYDPDKAILDFYPIKRIEGKDQIEGLVTAGPREIIETNIKAFQRAKLRPVRVDLSPFGLIRSLIDDNTREYTVILLNIGSQSTSLTVSDHGIPAFVRFIAAGSENIVSAIQNATGLDYDKALALQNGIGIGGTAPEEKIMKIAKIINEQSANLFRGIKQTIDFYQNQKSSNRYRSVILTGAGASVKGLAETFSSALGVPVIIGDPTKTINIDSNVQLPKNPVDISIAVGMALGEVDNK